MLGKKAFLIRVDEDFHRRAKLQATREGKSLQSWVAELIQVKLKKSKPSSWMCQECGEWSLSETSMAKLGKCEECGKDQIAIFPRTINI